MTAFAKESMARFSYVLAKMIKIKHVNSVVVFTHRNMGIMKYIVNRAFAYLRKLHSSYD